MLYMSTKFKNDAKNFATEKEALDDYFAAVKSVLDPAVDAISASMAQAGLISSTQSFDVATQVLTDTLGIIDQDTVNLISSTGYTGLPVTGNWYRVE